jgi:FkbM family methyltransferase
LGEFDAKIVADLTLPTPLGVFRYGFRDPVAWAIDSLLTEGDFMIDAGANIGMMTLVAAARVGSTGLVVSFEPSPSTAELLKRNVAVNGFHWVQIDARAVGDIAGTAEMIDFGRGAGLNSFAPERPEHGRTIHVGVVRIDDLVAKLGVLPALVKLDVEGAELRALRGSGHLLSARETSFIIEVDARHLRRQGGSVAELQAQMRGYEPFVIAADRRRFKLIRWPGPWESLPSSANLVLQPTRTG